MSDVPSTRGTGAGRPTAILQAALEVLREQGPVGLTVRNVADAAGCSTTGIYTYFGGKNGLVDAIYIQGFESFDAAIGPALIDGDLGTAGRIYRRWALEHRTEYMVMFGGAVPHHERSSAAQERGLLSFFKLAEGVRRVSPGDDFAERAYHLFATVHGYVMLELVDMSSATDTEAESLYERALQQFIR